MQVGPTSCTSRLSIYLAKQNCLKVATIVPKL